MAREREDCEIAILAFRMVAEPILDWHSLLLLYARWDWQSGSSSHGGLAHDNIRPNDDAMDGARL